MLIMCGSDPLIAALLKLMLKYVLLKIAKEADTLLNL